MANIRMHFLCSNSSDDYLEVDINQSKTHIFIKAVENSSISEVCLDKSTAIKLAKTIRTLINQIDIEEVHNGR